MRSSKALLSVAVSLFTLVGCGDDDPPPQIENPDLVVSNQSPPAPDVVTIDRVYAEMTGFLAIVQAVDGAAGAAPIGIRQVAPGEALDLEVALERPTISNEVLYARLHIDSNDNQELDWTPNGTLDPIVQVDGERLEKSFTITSTLPLMPSILVDDQPISTSSTGADQLVVKSAVTSTIGFVVIRDQVSISDPTVYGVEPLAVGLSAMLPVALTATTTPPAEALEAILYRDANGDGSFDAAVDQPLLVDGDTVRALFELQATTQ